jgi:hypothetical protein
VASARYLARRPSSGCLRRQQYADVRFDAVRLTREYPQAPTRLRMGHLVGRRGGRWGRHWLLLSHGLDLSCQGCGPQEELSGQSYRSNRVRSTNHLDLLLVSLPKGFEPIGETSVNLRLVVCMRV